MTLKTNVHIHPFAESLQSRSSLRDPCCSAEGGVILSASPCSLALRDAPRRRSGVERQQRAQPPSGRSGAGCVFSARRSLARASPFQELAGSAPCVEQPNYLASRTLGPSTAAAAGKARRMRRYRMKETGKNKRPAGRLGRAFARCFRSDMPPHTPRGHVSVSFFSPDGHKPRLWPPERAPGGSSSGGGASVGQNLHDGNPAWRKPRPPRTPGPTSPQQLFPSTPPLPQRPAGTRKKRNRGSEF